MHELLIKIAGMRLKSDFSAKVFVLRSMGNELVPSPLNRKRAVYICKANLCHL